MHKIFQNIFKKLGLLFLYTHGRFQPKLRRINVRKLKFSSFLIKRLDFRSKIARTKQKYIYGKEHRECIPLKNCTVGHSFDGGKKEEKK